MFEIELSHKVEIKDRNLKFKKSKNEKRHRTNELLIKISIVCESINQ